MQVVQILQWLVDHLKYSFSKTYDEQLFSSVFSKRQSDSSLQNAVKI